MFAPSISCCQGERHGHVVRRRVGVRLDGVRRLVSDAALAEPAQTALEPDEALRMQIVTGIHEPSAGADQPQSTTLMSVCTYGRFALAAKNAASVDGSMPCPLQALH